MVAKISVGNSLYGALAYNGEKINEAKGRLLTTNRIYNDGTGTMDIHRAMEDFLALMPVRSKVEKPVVHISLNPHPDDILTDTELQDIAWEYLEKMGFGNQPYLVFKHEDIDRHHLVQEPPGQETLCRIARGYCPKGQRYGRPPTLPEST